MKVKLTSGFQERAVFPSRQAATPAELTPRARDRSTVTQTARLRGLQQPGESGPRQTSVLRLLPALRGFGGPLSPSLRLQGPDLTASSSPRDKVFDNCCHGERSLSLGCPQTGCRYHHLFAISIPSLLLQGCSCL